MVELKNRDLLKHLRTSDLRGISQLSTQAITEVTRITEGVHQSVWRTVGAPNGKSAGQTRGITRISYASIYGITQLLGKGADILLHKLQPLFNIIDKNKPSTPQREAIIAALNGVIGDHLVETGNSLAIPMNLRLEGENLNKGTFIYAPEKQTTNVTPKILLMIHGLCMNDQQWNARHEENIVNHGEQLAKELGYTPIYLHYNSGRHISQNGRELSHQLAQLSEDWPVKIQEIAILAHSMGGLVARSACHYAESANLEWRRLLNKLVFLGTPHHGAPLEKAGNKIDIILGKTPYSAPFTQLGRLRSAGITDLRHGYLLDNDWMDADKNAKDRFDTKHDQHQHVNLPEGVACHTIAATTGSRRGILANHLIGDGLVPLSSALGEHKDNARALNFAPANQRVVDKINHMALLSHPEVKWQLRQWFKD